MAVLAMHGTEEGGTLSHQKAALGWADHSRNSHRTIYVDLWFEDAEDVEPRDVETVRREVAKDLAEGAFLVAVPRVSRSGKVQRVNISLERGILEAIDAAAAARKLTRSAFIAEAARNEITQSH